MPTLGEPSGWSLPEPFAIIVDFQAKSQHAAEFEAWMRRNARETLQDAGYLRMEVLRPVGEPNRLILSELWRNDAALEAHRAKPGHAATHAYDHLILSRRAIRCEVLPR